MSHASIHRAVAAALLAGLLAGTPAVAAYAFEPAPDSDGSVPAAEQVADATGQGDATLPAADGDAAGLAETTAPHDLQAGAGSPAFAPRRAPQAGGDSSQPVVTSLKLSGPVQQESYVGDTVALTATLTDADGAPIAGKQVKLTVYQPGVSGVTNPTYYQITDDDGVATFSVSGLGAGSYRAYAEFFGSQNFNESIYEASGESNTATLTVRPAEERPAPEQPAGDPTDTQRATTVSITSYTKNDYYSTSRQTLYDFAIAAYDADGKPVNDVEGSNNIELHIVSADGTEVVETKTLDPEGKYNDVGKAKITKQLSAGTYEVYVKYIGRNEYASSESEHLSLAVAGDRILEHVAAKAPSVEEAGNTEYWIEHGDAGDQYFSDADGTTSIALQDTVIAKLAPSITAGAVQSVTEGERKALTFRSNAPLADLLYVTVDGAPLGPDVYESASGSTLVTLIDDYVASLSVGQHTIAIVSEGGTAQTTFEVVAKKAPVTPPEETEGEGTTGATGSGEGTTGATGSGEGPAKPAGTTGATSPVAQTPAGPAEGTNQPAPAASTLPTTGDDSPLLFGSLLIAGALALTGSLLSRRRS